MLCIFERNTVFQLIFMQMYRTFKMPAQIKMMYIHQVHVYQ